MTNTIRIETFDADHDLYGNPTAHWQAWYNGEIWASSGKRREQIGYSGRVNESASYFLRKEFGIVIESDGKAFDRNGDGVEYQFSSESMENKKLIAVRLGEQRFNLVVKALTLIGASRKVSAHFNIRFRHYRDNVFHSKDNPQNGYIVEPFNFEKHSQIEVIEL